MLEEKDILVEEILDESIKKDYNKKEKPTKKTTPKYVLYKGDKKEILKQTKDKYLIEVTITNLQGKSETKKQWFYKNALEIVKE